MISEAHNIDNMIAMAQMLDKAFDLAILDVPFGLGEGRNHATRSGYVKQRNGSRLYVEPKHALKDWDASQPEQAYFNEAFRVAKKHIIFGENYLQFNQKPTSSGRIFWDKLTTGDFSDGEMIWTNLFSSVRQVRYMWSGMMQGVSFGNYILDSLT